MVSEALKGNIINSESYNSCFDACNSKLALELNELINQSEYWDREDVDGIEGVYYYIRQDLKEEI